MMVNVLSRAFDEVSQTRSFLLGTAAITKTSRQSTDFLTVVNGLVLWFGILLDYNNLLFASMHKSMEQRARSRGGRLRFELSTGWPTQECFPLEALLTALDNLATCHLDMMRGSLTFKESELQHLVEEVNKWKNCSQAALHANAGQSRASVRVCTTVYAFIAGLVTDYAQCEFDCDGGGARLFSMIRQITCFLTKLQVDRADLTAAAIVSFHESEDELMVRFGPDSLRTDSYTRDVLDMRRLLLPHVKELDWSKFVPCHGSGAVADSKTKSWFDKYMNFDLDQRLAYLLGHSGLGTETDYSPFARPRSSSTRTSRFISVPKTWKKLRGISAEPAELQFWQQGLASVIDTMFRRDVFWRTRVDLHDQTKSQKMALSGSQSGDYATVDLSAASDSVSLRLVRDLFGTSELGRWLLGTRSVYTVVDGTRRKLYKFAPMGSCTCFPTECIIFVLAAELAVRRTRSLSSNRRQVCVYGDDIIVPTYAYDELLSILGNLGFTINTSKSFHQGGFRESCGAEAWRGVDIAPLRYKTVPLGAGSTRVDSKVLSSGLALANGLFSQGLHDTRAWFLQHLYAKYVELPFGPSGRGARCKLPAQMAFFATFDGGHSTLATPTPTNFHLRRKYDRNLQTIVYEVIRWKLREREIHVEETYLSQIDACRLIEWLARHAQESCDINAPIPYTLTPLNRVTSFITRRTEFINSVVADGLVASTIYPADLMVDKRLVAAARVAIKEFLRGLVSDYEDANRVSLDAYDRVPIGTTLIPCKRWVDPAYLLSQAFTIPVTK